MENKFDLSVVKEKIEGMTAMLASSPVTNEAECAEVAVKVSNIKKLAKFIEQEKDKYVEPAKEIIASAKAQYDPYIEACKQAEKELKRRADVFLTALDDKRKADEKAIADRVGEGRGKLKVETAAKKIENLAEAPKTIKVAGGPAITRVVRDVAEIVDRNLIPDEFWVVNEVLVRQTALARHKAGAEQIPGVIIKQESSISSR